MQLLAVVAVSVFSAIVTLAILKGVERVVGLRVTPEEERMGLDLSQHNERAVFVKGPRISRTFQQRIDHSRQCSRMGLAKAPAVEWNPTTGFR